MQTYTYSASDNLTSQISRVLIGRHLNICSLTSPTCCNLPRKCTPVKYKARKKAEFPILTEAPSINSCRTRTEKTNDHTRIIHKIQFRSSFKISTNILNQLCNNFKMKTFIVAIL